MSNKATAKRAGALFGLALLACSACVADVVDHPTTAAEGRDAPSTVTGERASATYSYDHKTLIVPPVLVPPTVVLATDGKATNTMEYAGSVGVPVVNRVTHATGQARVTVDPAFSHLRVLFESVPLPVSATALNNHALCVYIDSERFDGAADARAPRPEDHGFCINLQNGEKFALVGTSVGGTQGWVPVGAAAPPLNSFQKLMCRLFPKLSYCPRRGGQTPLNWQVAINKIVNTTNSQATNVYASAEVEFEIPLGGLLGVDDKDPNGDHYPGIGLAFALHGPRDGGVTSGNANAGLHGTSAGSAATVVAGYPDAVGVGSQDGGVDSSALTTFGYYKTVLFGRPAGIPLKVMSWNVKRFTGFMSGVESLSGNDTFPDNEVNPADIGRFLAENDIVGLQEGWDKDEVYGIRDAANERRAALGLAPYELYGPLDWGPSTLLPKELGELGVEMFDETQGGVWILSRFPAAIKNQGHIFDACRAEDCLKAKGVQWVRLWLGAPPPDCVDRCEAHGGEYIDVFNMHLNASSSTCDSKATIIALRTAIDTAMGASIGAKTGGGVGIGAGIGAIVGVLDGIFADNFHCSKYASDVIARQVQIKEAGDYIRQNADPERPSIIMGDFNVEGAVNISGQEYRHLLHYFDLANALPAPASIDGVDTWSESPDTVYTEYMTPWVKPYGWDWSVDHADSFRNALPWQTDAQRDTALQDKSPEAPMSQAEASFIRRVQGKEFTRATYLTSGTELRRSAPSNEGRFDYIFFRQPQKVLLDNGSKTFPKFAIARQDGTRSLCSSTFRSTKRLRFTPSGNTISNFA